MNRSMAIARREFDSYFRSPIAYVVITAFLIASGFAFYQDFVPGEPATMRNTLNWMVWFLVFLTPILSMGLLAQEWSSGTIETLMTAPVNDLDVVLGKFFGNFALLVVMLIPTLLYVALLAIYARPDLGPIFSGYVGILLTGALFIAIGVFCSSLTRSQMVAVVLAVLILCLATVVPYLIRVEVANMRPFFLRMLDQTVYRRYSDFSKGVLDLGNIVFFLLSTAVFLFLTVKVLESRRWK
ncbi:MAG TPA: ABC transporter permease [Tepidisphaeraceae bacterium]|nr:ABC transporter permease [Tepidisphaeraceae bacterium]